MGLLDILFGPPVPEMTVQAFEAALRSGRVHAIDVREHVEWKKGHIEGVQHIPLSHLKHQLGDIPRDRPIAIICRSGHRSAVAARMMLKAGFTEVYSVRGGMNAWVKAHLPVREFAN